MGSELTNQFFNVTPGEVNQIVVLAVDSTSRTYDLKDLNWGGTPYKNGMCDQALFLQVTAETADVYYAFSDASGVTIDNTATIAAGGTIAFAATYCDRWVKDVPSQFRFDRIQHRYLTVKTSAGTATIRVTKSSQTNVA